MPATGSTASWPRGGGPRTTRSSSRPGTRRWPPSRRWDTRSSPAGSASAWPRRERAPTALIIPADVQELEYSAPAHAFKMVPSSLGTDWPVTAPQDEAILRAAEVLNAGSKVAILAGQGARGARGELEEIAELLGAGVAKPLLGKDVLSDELPYVTGAIGLLGTRPSYELMMNCDTLLTVGSNFPYTQFLPDFGQARGVQIDIDGK